MSASGPRVHEVPDPVDRPADEAAPWHRATEVPPSSPPPTFGYTSVWATEYVGGKEEVVEFRSISAATHDVSLEELRWLAYRTEAAPRPEVSSEPPKASLPQKVALASPASLPIRRRASETSKSKSSGKDATSQAEMVLSATRATDQRILFRLMKKRDWERTEDDIKSLHTTMQGMPFFAAIAPVERNRLYMHARYVTFQPGDFLYHEDDGVENIYVMLTGHVSYVHMHSKECIGGIGNAWGQLVGGMGGMSEDTHAHSAIVVAAEKSHREKAHFICLPYLEYARVMKLSKTLTGATLSEIIGTKVSKMQDFEKEMVDDWLGRIGFLKMLTRKVRLACCEGATLARIRANTVVVRQGDGGAVFFIILSGTASVHVVTDSTISVPSHESWEKCNFNAASSTLSNKKAGKTSDLEISTFGTCVKMYQPGEAFGELALAQANATRSATIITREGCEFMAITKDVYDSIIKNYCRHMGVSLQTDTARDILLKEPEERSAADLKLVEDITSHIRFFQQVPGVMHRQLCEVMRCDDVVSGDCVVVEGEEGELAMHFYVILSGSYGIFKHFNKLLADVTDSEHGSFLGTLSAGDSFGELALLNNAPRNATIMCLEKGCVMKIAKYDYDSTIKTLGSTIFYAPQAARMCIRALSKANLEAEKMAASQGHSTVTMSAANLKERRKQLSTVVDFLKDRPFFQKLAQPGRASKNELLMVASSLRLKLVNANKPVYTTNDKVKGFFIILAGSCSEHKLGAKPDSSDEAEPADEKRQGNKRRGGIADEFSLVGRVNSDPDSSDEADPADDEAAPPGEEGAGGNEPPPAAADQGDAPATPNEEASPAAVPMKKKAAAAAAALAALPACTGMFLAGAAFGRDEILGRDNVLPRQATVMAREPTELLFLSANSYIKYVLPAFAKAEQADDFRSRHGQKGRGVEIHIEPEEMARRQKLIAQAAIFHDLPSDKHRENCCRMLQEEEVGPNEVVFLQGAAGDKFYILCEGSYEVWVRFDVVTDTGLQKDIESCRRDHSQAVTKREEDAAKAAAKAAAQAAAKAVAKAAAEEANPDAVVAAADPVDDERADEEEYLDPLSWKETLGKNVFSSTTPGSSFGEKALIDEGESRKATICTGPEGAKFVVLTKSAFELVGLKEIEAARQRETLQHFTQLSLFAGCTMSSLHRLIPTMTEVAKKRGDVITKCGSESSSWYIIISGECRVVHRSDEPLPHVNGGFTVDEDAGGDLRSGLSVGKGTAFCDMGEGLSVKLSQSVSQVQPKDIAVLHKNDLFGEEGMMCLTDADFKNYVTTATNTANARAVTPGLKKRPKSPLTTSHSKRRILTYKFTVVAHTDCVLYEFDPLHIMPLIPKRDLAQLKIDAALKMARWNDRGLAKTFFQTPAEGFIRPATAMQLMSSLKMEGPASPRMEEPEAQPDDGRLPAIITSSLEPSIPLSVLVPSPSHPLRRAASTSGLPSVVSPALRDISPRTQVSPMSVETRLTDEHAVLLPLSAGSPAGLTNPFPSPKVTSPKVKRNRSAVTSSPAVHSINRRRNGPLI